MDLEFRSQLVSLLKVCCCPEERITNLLRNVFFENVHVRLVLSIPNTFTKQNMNNYGHLRLRQIIRDLNDYYSEVPQFPVTVSPILSLCSSVGSPSPNWLRSILSSCNGGLEIPFKKPMEELVHMVFPTSAYVSHSRIGPDRAGSLILSRQSYWRKTFPKKCLKRYCDIKGRENTLPHAKYCKSW